MAKRSPSSAIPRDLRIEYAALSEIQRWPRNPKGHDLAALNQSLARFGYVQPLLVDEKSGRLVAGHGRLDALIAAKQQGGAAPDGVRTRGRDWLVPVIRGVSSRMAKEAEAYLLADNRLVEAGGWDEEVLTAMLADLDDLSGTGFADFAATEADWSEGAEDLGMGNQAQIMCTVVIACEEAVTVEEALDATGEANRGAALLAICAAYLERRR